MPRSLLDRLPVPNNHIELVPGKIECSRTEVANSASNEHNRIDVIHQIQIQIQNANGPQIALATSDDSALLDSTMYHDERPNGLLRQSDAVKGFLCTHCNNYNRYCFFFEMDV